jgi:hypothetical protein
MSEATPAPSADPGRLPRILARGIASLWAGFWVWFAGLYLVGGLFTKSAGPVRWEGVAMCALVIALAVTAAGLAWRHERIGGIVLLLLGVAIVVVTLAHPPGGVRGLAGAADALLYTALVPLVAGGLLVFARSRRGQVGAP